VGWGGGRGGGDECAKLKLAMGAHENPYIVAGG
jgi:hypothetical protein